jgi:hypothetical protein
VIAVFYDRKNKQEIRSDKLMHTKLVTHSLRIDCEERTRGEWQGRKKERAYLHEEIISDLCYKTPACPKHMNWDRDLTINDLVFLRLEEE